MIRDDEIFADALALPRSERAVFLERACKDDAACRGRIDALLNAHESPDNPLAARSASVPRLFAEGKPGDHIGRYTLLEKVGEGGCGVVWMAEQKEPVRRCVAIKVIKLGMDTRGVVARFEGERQALALMDHPNIAKVLDGGATETGRPFFVMEFVRGIPITRYCDEKLLPMQDRLQLFIQVCHAIQHAHQKGIIHRDIKPSNVLVTVHDAVAVPIVIDFGIAKATQGKLTDTTVITAFDQFIGTPVYMSPEQADPNDPDIDTRSDIYSLGVLLYELLTGRRPFEPKTLTAGGYEQVRRLIRESELPRPSTRLRALTDEERTTIAKTRSIAASRLAVLLRGDLDWIVMKAVEKNRTRRYQTANALAADVQRHLANEPVVARAPSRLYALGKFVRRNQLAVAATAAIALTLVIGTMVSTWQARRARQAEELAATGRLNAEKFLAFIVSDLAVELTDYGHVRAIRRLGEHTLAYYESIPPRLHTRETRANYALALVGAGALGREPVRTSPARAQGAAEARECAQRAVAMFEELEATGPLTAVMQVGFAASLRALAGHVQSHEAVQLCDRAVAVVSPALTDDRWGLAAHNALAGALEMKASLLVSNFRLRDASAAFEKALASALEADRRQPPGRIQGLVPALLRAQLARQLFRSDLNRGIIREEVIAMTDGVSAELRALVEQQPFLISARRQLVHVNGLQAEHAHAVWKHDYATKLLATNRDELVHLQKFDPDNSERQDEPGGSILEFKIAWDLGDFAVAELHLLRRIEGWTHHPHADRAASNVATLRFYLARLCAATGRSEDCERHLVEAETGMERIVELRGIRDPVELAEHFSFGNQRRRRADFHRLDWAAMRRNAEADLAALASLPAEVQSDRRVIAKRRSAQHDLIRAALESGDYVTARATLREVTFTGLQSNASLQNRFDQLDTQLTCVAVLAGSGEMDTARATLDEAWPEVEALLAAGPHLPSNLAQTARAWQLKATIAPISEDEKRALLQCAAGCLRPAAAAGKLTRYELEIRLHAVEMQLSARFPPTLP